MSLLVVETSDFQYWRYVITLPRFRMSPYGGALQTGPRAFCISYSPHTDLPSPDYYRLKQCQSALALCKYDQSRSNVSLPYCNFRKIRYLVQCETSLSL